MRGLGPLPFATAAAFGLSAFALTIFPIVSPQVVSELQLSYTEAGGLTSAYILSYGLFQIPGGLLGMWLGGGRVLLAAVALTTGSAFIGIFASDFAGWLVSRLLLGLGGAAVLPVSLHLLTAALTGSRLVTGIGIFVTGWGAGMTLGLLGAAQILTAYGWREVLMAATALGGAVFVFLWWAVRGLGEESGRGDPFPPGLSSMLSRLATNRPLNLMSLINMAGTTTVVSVPAWLPLYLAHGLGASSADGALVLAWIGIGFVAGSWSGGALANRSGWRAVVLGSFLVSVALIVSIPLLGSIWQAVVVATLLGWAAMMFPAPVQALFPAVVPTEWTGLAAGYYNTIGFAGAFVASLLFGSLVDWTGLFAAGWVWLALAPGLGIAATWALSGHLGSKSASPPPRG